MTHQEAVSQWVRIRGGWPKETDISDIKFSFSANGCDTCGWGEGHWISYKADGEDHDIELDFITPVELVQECIEIFNHPEVR